MDYPISPLYFLSIQTRLKAHTHVNQENTSDKWNTMVYYERALYNYFIPFHTVPNKINATYARGLTDGKVGYSLPAH